MAKTTALETPVQYLKGVGPKLARIFSKLDILSVEDLLYFFPRDYEDRSNPTPMASLNAGHSVLVRGEIVKIDAKNSHQKIAVVKATLADSTGQIKAVWFNQPYLTKLFRYGMRLFVSGRVEYNPFESGLQLNVRDFEIDNGLPLSIVPIYPLTEGLYQKKVRLLVNTALDVFLGQIIDPLPPHILQKYSLPGLRDAVKDMHLPQSKSKVERARKRLVFEDFFVFQLGLALRQRVLKETVEGRSFRIDGELFNRFSSELPFELTSAQKRVLEEIKTDMASNCPMKRLLQGDVGSGKTIVATAAAVIAAQNDMQTAFMAPTEILAQQHFEKTKKLLAKLKIKAALLTGASSAAEKKRIAEGLRTGKISIVIGTHALIQEKIDFKALGLALVDEQHRFGVMQRTELLKKGVNLSAGAHGTPPDMLFMTATPIPRSLALTLYGDLDRSVIDELPPGRTPVKTYFVPEQKRVSSYEFMREQINEGRQIYFVYPLVEESEEMDLKNATDEAQRLQNEIFPEFKIGLVHGRIKGDEKENIMGQFKSGKINILVSTTVIEVGIDVPNASVMVIEHVERFGLSQLHQLRGRVGRGASLSYCFLVGDPRTPESRQRVKAMLESTDGFHIAEVDLRLRGPGDFCGVRQSGLPNFRMADIIRDNAILKTARQAAFEHLAKDPGLVLPENRILKESLFNRFGKVLDLETIH
ncbi:MAG: ATP-dependent DNA helicase RecG [Candidatus Margulisbacteria bacterium]|nr:ATP-dependent DNA helicase RecG [Candidatus Margulisiibacteriota bacterium]